MHLITVYHLRTEADLDVVGRFSALSALFLPEDSRLLLTTPDRANDSGQLLDQKQFAAALRSTTSRA